MKASKDTMRCYKYFTKFAWRTDKLYFLLLLIGFVTDSITPFITIIGSQYLIDEIADVSKRDMKTIIFWVTFICLGNFICQNLKKIVSEHTGRINEKYTRILKTQHSMSCIRMKFQNTEDTDVLDTIENAQRALNETGLMNGLIAPIGNIASNFMIALGVVVLVCTKIPWLMIPVVISFVANFIITSKVNKSRRNFFKDMGHVERGSSYYTTELMESRYAKDVRLYDAPNIFLEQYEGYVDRIYDTSKKYNLKFIRYWNVNDLFYAISDTSIYILLTINVVKKAITVGEFSSLLQATSKFGRSIRQIVNAYLGINYAVSVLKFYVDFVENIATNSEKLMDLSDNGVEADASPCEVEFKNVSFKYPNTEKYILKNISVKIRAGEHLSIVGQNGAGKTTFIKLLCRLYDNYEGEILVNGKNAKDYNFVDYMKVLSVVFQDFRLFAFTLKENVTMFKEKDIDLEETYKIAGIDEWVENLQDRDETYIYKMFDESGVEPSGGQGQKLAIARALYKNAPIVVLDEPTAALDPLSEYEIYQNFDKLVQNKTAVYISHRLSSCQFCDRIIVFNDGKIIEEGTHRQLMDLPDGFYANMYLTQAKQYKKSQETEAFA